MVTATVKRCGNCRYWSDLVVRSSRGTVKAQCLRKHGEGPYAQTYTTENRACCEWECGEPMWRGKTWTD